jgi:hypothetical protein
MSVISIPSRQTSSLSAVASIVHKTRPTLRRIAEIASGTFADVKSSVL